MPSVLSAEQVNQFIHSGCCFLEAAYPKATARALAECIWKRIEETTQIRRSDRQTWPSGYFLPRMKPNELSWPCMTPRLENAIVDLIGPYNHNDVNDYWNFPVNFPLLDRVPGDIPSGGWHLDGEWETDTLEHLPHSLIILGLVTDVEPGFGGTVFALGSHKTSTRLIANPETNLSRVELFKSLVKEPIGNFHEMTGRAGDVILAHPLLLHTTGFNCTGPARIINAIRVSALSPLRLDRPDDDLSPFELSIRVALNTMPDLPEGAKLCRAMLD